MKSLFRVSMASGAMLKNDSPNLTEQEKDDINNFINKFGIKKLETMYLDNWKLNMHLLKPRKIY